MKVRLLHCSALSLTRLRRELPPGGSLGMRNLRGMGFARCPRCKLFMHAISLSRLKAPAFGPGRKHSWLPALAKNMPPAYFLNASRPPGGSLTAKFPFILSFNPHKKRERFSILQFFGKRLILSVFYDKLYILFDENEGELH